MSEITETTNAFDRFNLASGMPSWSSEMLEQFLKELTIGQSKPMGDVIHALDLALDRYQVPLTDVLANFIRDVSIGGLILHGSWWEAAEWNWALEEFRLNPTPARSYLRLRNLPFDQAPLVLRECILQALDGTAWASEARIALEDEPDTNNVLADVAHGAGTRTTSIPL